MPPFPSKRSVDGAGLVVLSKMQLQPRNALYNPVVIVVVVIIVVVVDMATPPDDSPIIASTGHRRPGPSRGFQTPHADMQTMQAAVQSG